MYDYEQARAMVLESLLRQTEGDPLDELVLIDRSDARARLWLGLLLLDQGRSGARANAGQ